MNIPQYTSSYLDLVRSEVGKAVKYDFTTDVVHAIVAQVEEACLLAAYNSCHRNKSKMAKALGMNRSTLRKKLKLYGIDQNG